MNEELDSETSGAKPGRPARLQTPVVQLGTPIHSPDFPPDASQVDAANALVAMNGRLEAAKTLVSLKQGGLEGRSTFPPQDIEKTRAYDPRSRDGRDGR